MVKVDYFHKIFASIPDVTYPIFIGNGLLQDEDLLRAYVNQQVLIVTDEIVADYYLSSLTSIFSDRLCQSVIIKAGERFKTMDSLISIYDQLCGKNYHRDATLIALGGGVIGDLAGFAAATYQRGMNFVNIPTTLLAQVDAAIGGKTAINYHNAKNMIGTFYQPKAVFSDLNVLISLSAREYVAGFSEIIKYALLSSEAMFVDVEKIAALGDTRLHHDKLATLIVTCCQKKVEIVTQDVKEVGCRALLNLGHTLAHALESVTHYERFLHGEAVGIGLYFAASLSVAMKVAEPDLPGRIAHVLNCLNLPSHIPNDIDNQALYHAMWHDKKIQNEKLRFILIRKPGDCYVLDNIQQSCIMTVLKEVTEGVV